LPVGPPVGEENRNFNDVGRHHFAADLDPTFYFDADPDLDPSLKQGQAHGLPILFY
jgi:hypothetical protein